MDEGLSDVLEKSDRLFEDCKFEEAVQLLKPHVNSNKFEVLWRAARAINALFKELIGSQSKKANALIPEGFQIASTLLEKYPQESKTHQYYAIFLGQKAEIDGVRKQILSLTTILDHIKKARELDPQDPLGWHLEGNFYEKLCSLQWFEKKFAAALIPDLQWPSYDDALRCLLKAEELKPNFSSLNLYLIGKVYYGMKDYDSARSVLERVINWKPVRTADDRFSIAAARKLQQKL
ncbi:regulator of microtubule dynamics protein 1-like [Uranotaenia lowii]|uniref:regulator of microtubule dynamics protein 1-like n=1 Tax=Uranotaenia lowii TaxID=190385 RepID=UPI00247967B7|nr:regulator of microtubule dynamics protein 1-like [Uranotaenia lowii]